MPQVVGALLSGLLLGPAFLGILHKTDFLKALAELGVIVIMFNAGMETNIQELKQSGKAGFTIALYGVLVPLGLGTLLGFVFNRGALADGGNTLMQNIFVGVILTATSVSITVETLKEMGKLTTKVGNTILAAALIDDVLGLICLTLVTSLSGGESVSVSRVLIKIILFFVFAAVLGITVQKGLTWYSRRNGDVKMQRYPVLALAFCLLMAYAAEHYFGVADIIGAFTAGLVIGNIPVSNYVEARFRPVSYMLLTPVFFASIGIGIILPDFSWTMVLLSFSMIAAAVLSKLIGCGLGAKFCGMSSRESVQIGFGMVCRGEVALVIANKGQAMGMLPPAFLGAAIITVIFASIVTPILLKLVFHSPDPVKEAAPVNARIA